MIINEFELDHIGIAVSSLKEGEAFYKTLGLAEPRHESVSKEKVNVAIFGLGNSCNIELIEASSRDSTIAKFIEKKGQGIHHICLRVTDLKKTLNELKGKGVNLIHEEPFVGAHNCLVAFIHPKSTGGVLIELSQPAANNEVSKQ